IGLVAKRRARDVELVAAALLAGGALAKLALAAGIGTGEQAFDAPATVGDLALEHRARALQLELDAPVQLGAEQRLEDALAVLRVGDEQAPELALRQQHDLAELLELEAEQLADLRVDVEDL